jgi:hypothetical protein
MACRRWGRWFGSEVNAEWFVGNDAVPGGVEVMSEGAHGQSQCRGQGPLGEGEFVAVRADVTAADSDGFAQVPVGTLRVHDGTPISMSGREHRTKVGKVGKVGSN